MTHDLLALAEWCENKIHGFQELRDDSPSIAKSCDAIIETLTRFAAAIRAAHEEIQRLREPVKQHEDEISNIKLSCIKCGGTDIYTSFHQKLECDYSSRNKSSSEHLHRTCRTCRYDWIDTPLDAIETAMKEAK